MCGINGFISFVKKSNTEFNINKMNNLIVHRGPDSDGKFIYECDSYELALGMRRLSIIDINNGTQPIKSKDNSIVIVFNGEIYNFKELKKQLISDGCEFLTNSDTEVILKLYEKEGAESFSKLDGMFAFCIFDKSLERIYLTRDFFGEKPLYYTKTENGFAWSSELKSILSILPFTPEIDKLSLSIFLQLTYIPAPYSIYQGINKLEPNHYIEFSCKTNQFTIHEINHSPKSFSISSKKDAIVKTHDLINESVSTRSISDVPIGTFLSGGVDSSIVSMCLAQQSNKTIDTFSIGFEKKSFDESEKSRLVSKLINSNHHEFIISEKDLSENFHDIVLNFDEPFADSSALATYLVSKKTKEYVKVALTGDGGDEVFGGYNKYFMGKLNEKYTSLIPEKFHINILQFASKFLKIKEDSRGVRFKMNRVLNSINYEDNYYYNIISLGFTDFEIKEMLNSDFYFPNSLNNFKNKVRNNKNSIANFREIDKQLSLEGDMLVKVDRTSMLASLECRAPFLNRTLWDFTNQLPDSYLINGWEKKHILKEAFKKYFPNKFLNSTKKGFGVPVGDWLRSELREELLTFLDPSFLKKQNIFQLDNISILVHNHLNGKVDNTFRVWTFYCFQKWYKFNYIN